MTVAQFNTHIRDNETWLKAALTQLNVTSDVAKAKITPALVGAHVTRAADQTITDSTLTAIAFDTERFDSDAFHDNVTLNTRLTVPVGMGGYYLVGAQASWQGNATGYRHVRIRINGGATYLATGHSKPNTTESTTSNVVTLTSLVAGDFVELIVFQSSGVSLSVVMTGQESPNLWLHRISSS